MCSFIVHGQTNKVLVNVVKKDQTSMVLAHFSGGFVHMRELCA